MSLIEKMSVMGIRSFGPEDRNKGVIEFFTPLTLILGPNGSGKTTIIECLRYMTTGDTPPNSDRGSSFVHDPKIAGETEVKGQVKLQLRDVTNKRLIATRNLLVTQKQKKVQMKTLEGNITRYSAGGDKSSLSSKCAEIDKEMVAALGVSKPILNNVIFCHQEESNWPLSEGKALKQKFDEIFAATRYIKALEEIRKIRLEKVGDTKKYKSEVVYLKENRRKADEFGLELNKTETRLAACRDAINNVEDKLKPVTDKLTDIARKEQHIAKLQGTLESNRTLLKKYEGDQRNLRTEIKNLFSGSKDELLEEMENFNAAVSEKKKQLEKVKRDHSNVEREQSTLMKSRTKLTEELGQLKTEHKQHEQRIAQRDAKLGELSNMLGLGDITHESEEPLRESQVQSVLRNWRQKLEASHQELNDSKKKHEAKEDAVQSQLNSVRDSVSQKVQKQKSSLEKLSKNKTTIQGINEELSQAGSLAARQDDLKQDISEIEVELSAVEKQVDVAALRQEISLSQRKRKEKDSQLNTLNQELHQLHKESKLRTEIELSTKEKKLKQDAVDKLSLRHKDTVIHLSKSVAGVNYTQEANPQDIVRKVMELLKREIQSHTKTMDETRSKLSSLKTTKEFHVAEVKKKEKSLISNKQKIADVCGNQNFDEGFDVLEKTIKELQDEKGALTGSLFLYNKYVEKLGNRNPCCPLCTRAFDTDAEVKSLIQDLQKKLQLVPSQMDKKEKLLETHQRKLNKMLEMRPLKQEMANMSDVELPALRLKIETVSKKIEESIDQISGIEDVLESKNCDLKMASDILPDLVMLDQNQRELERLERRLSSLTCQLVTEDVTRTVQVVSDEINNLHSEIEHLRNEIDAKQQRINDHGEAVQRLKSQLNDLRAEQVQIAGRLQKKNSLEEQLMNFSVENSELTELVKELKIEITKLEREVQSLLKEKKDVSVNKEKELEKIRNKIDKEKKEMESIDRLTKDIDSYVNEGREERLLTQENKISSINSNIDKKSADLSKLTTDEKNLTKEILNQQLKYREYEDNKKLIELGEEIAVYKEKCDKLESDIGGLDVRTFLTEKRRLIEQERQLTKELNENEGRKGELVSKVSALQKQLQDKIFKDAEKKHRDMLIQLRTTELTCEDLNKYYIALDRAVMRYHQLKMDEINKIVRDLWIKTYSGNDIDYIEIRSNEDESESGLEKARRIYNYKVVMVKGDKVLDLRGRCSAGQKVLASLLIRLALAEVFCLHCGILALDEPTTNLDRDNICNLARALVEIVQSRSEQKNFQLIIITHDEDFIDLLGRSETVDYFYKVSKDANSCSRVSKCRLSEMN